MTDMRSIILAAALAALAGPSVAQDLCGVSGSPVTWAGGTAEASDIATAAAAFDATVDVAAQGRSLVAFALSDAMPVRVEALPSGPGDTVIELLDGAGASLGSNDDFGGSVGSRLDLDLQPGQYCLAVAGFEGSALGAYVRVGQSAHAPLIEETFGGTTVPAAIPCGPDAVVRDVEVGALQPGAPLVLTGSVDEAPYTRLILSEPQALTLTLENLDADPAFSVYDEAGTQLADNDDTNGLNAMIEFPAPLAAGRYCIAARALNDTAASLTLTVAAFDAEAAARRNYDSGLASPPLDGSYPVESLGLLGAQLSRDMFGDTVTKWFSFEVAEPGLVLVEGYGFGADPKVTLFDGAGRPVGENDDSGTGSNARVAARLVPGSYTVGISALGSGGLLRLVMERFVPAP
jgi:hypothetical protein